MIISILNSKRTKVNLRHYKSNIEITLQFIGIDYCMNTGNATDNCNRKIACTICASEVYIKKDCPYSKDLTDLNVKCLNCALVNKPSHDEKTLLFPHQNQNTQRLSKTSKLKLSEICPSFHRMDNFIARIPQSFKPTTSLTNNIPTCTDVAEGDLLYSIEELFLYMCP